MRKVKKIYEYKKIEGISELYMDYLLVNSIPRNFFENLLKNSPELTKSLRLTGFRVNQIDEFKLKSAFAKQLIKDANLYSMICTSWIDLYDEDLDMLKGLDKEEFIATISEALEINLPADIVNHIRVEREDLYDLVLPFIKEWHTKEENARDTAEKFNFSYDGQSFTELFGVDPFLEEDALSLDLDFEDEDFDVFREAVDEDVKEQRKLLKNIYEMPVDKSLNTIILGLNSLKNKLNKATDYESLYKQNEEELESAKEELIRTKAEINELRNNLKSKESSIQKLQQKNNLSEKSLETINQKLANSHVENGRLGADVGSLRKECTDYREKLLKLEKELENIKENQDKKEKKLIQELEKKHLKEINALKSEYTNKIIELENKAKTIEIKVDEVNFNSENQYGISEKSKLDVTIIDAVPGLKELYEDLQRSESTESDKVEHIIDEEEYVKGTISFKEETEKVEDIKEESMDDFDWFANLDEFSPQ